MKKFIFLVALCSTVLFSQNLVSATLPADDYALVKQFHEDFENATDYVKTKTFTQKFNALALEKQKMVIQEKLNPSDGGNNLLSSILNTSNNDDYTKTEIASAVAKVADPVVIYQTLQSYSHIPTTNNFLLEQFLTRLSPQEKDDLIFNNKNAVGKNWWDLVMDKMQEIKEIKYKKEDLNLEITNFKVEQYDNMFEKQLLFLKNLSVKIDKDSLILGSKEERAEEFYQLKVHTPLVYLILAYQRNNISLVKTKYHPNAQQAEILAIQQDINAALKTILSSFSSQEVIAQALELKIYQELNYIAQNQFIAPLLFNAMIYQTPTFVSIILSVFDQKTRDHIILKTYDQETLEQKTIFQETENGHATKESNQEIIFKYSALSFTAAKSRSSHHMQAILAVMSEDARKQGLTNNEIINFYEVVHKIDSDGSFLEELSRKKYSESLNLIQSIFYIGSHFGSKYFALQGKLDVIFSHNIISPALYPFDSLWERFLKAHDHKVNHYNKKDGKPCSRQIHKDQKYCKSKLCPDSSCELCKQGTPLQEDCEFCSFSSYSNQLSAAYESYFNFCLTILKNTPDQNIRNQRIIDNEMLSYAINVKKLDYLEALLNLVSDDKKEEAIIKTGLEGKSPLHWAALVATQKINKTTRFMELLIATAPDKTKLKEALEVKGVDGKSALDIYPAAQTTFDAKVDTKGLLNYLTKALEILKAKLVELAKNLEALQAHGH
ncbi:hypothetical protein IPF37_06060 [bacterium]|nr:MAG: hypothetical protein IPF37_06060 [bacterium]